MKKKREQKQIIDRTVLREELVERKWYSHACQLKKRNKNKNN